MTTTIKFWGEQIIPIGNRHYLVESWAEPGEHHAVDLEEGSCSCEGFGFTGYCRHLEVLQEYERRQQS